MLTDEIVMYLTSYEGAIQSSNNWYKKWNKSIDRVYIEVIDHRIWDRMDKISMNQPLHPVILHFHYDI